MESGVCVNGGPVVGGRITVRGSENCVSTGMVVCLWGAAAGVLGNVLQIGDVGVGNIADAARLHVDDLIRLGDDILVVATPKGASARVHWDH
mgnify:CR=1 FL=1